MDQSRPIVNGGGSSRGDFDRDVDAGSFVPLLLSIAKATRALFELRMAEIGLHAGQDQLLTYLKPGAPYTSIAHVAVALHVRPSTVSKMVDRLAEHGLIERSGHPSDARRKTLRLTPAGTVMQERIETCWHAVTAEMERSLGERFGTVVREMHVLDKCLSERLARLR